MKTTRFVCDFVIAAMCLLQFTDISSAQPGAMSGAMGMPPGVPSAPKDRIEGKNLLVIETKNGLSAYSKTLGKWDSVVVGLPKDGLSRLKYAIVSNSFAEVVIDDQLFGFSSEAGRWDKLTIPEEYVGKIAPIVGDALTVKVAEQTWALSPKTGKWTSPDGDQASTLAETFVMLILRVPNED